MMLSPSLPEGAPPFAPEGFDTVDDRETKIQAISTLEHYIASLQFQFAPTGGQEHDEIGDNSSVEDGATTLYSPGLSGYNADSGLNFRTTLEDADGELSADNHATRQTSLAGPVRTKASRLGSARSAKGREHGHLPYPQIDQAPRRIRKNGAALDPSLPPFQVDVANYLSRSTEDANPLLKQTRNTGFCPVFTVRGLCSSTGCQLIHDDAHRAACKHWLYRNGCDYGPDTCRLLHETNAHNAPTCLHFLLGSCTNRACKFAHTRLPPSAPLCSEFGRLGYCEKGNQCQALHLLECPDFYNYGYCPSGTDCHLRHVKDASKIRSTLLRTSGRAESQTDKFVHDSQPRAFIQQESFVALDK